MGPKIFLTLNLITSSNIIFLAHPNVLQSHSFSSPPPHIFISCPVYSSHPRLTNPPGISLLMYDKNSKSLSIFIIIAFTVPSTYLIGNITSQLSRTYNIQYFRFHLAFDSDAGLWLKTSVPYPLAFWQSTSFIFSKLSLQNLSSRMTFVDRFAYLQTTHCLCGARAVSIKMIE